MKHLMIGLINLYRKFISPIKPPCCRFTPTCSAYALEAFKKRGFFIGFILTVWRILRCNPFSKGGYDPVPEKGLRNKSASRKMGDVAEGTSGEHAERAHGATNIAQEKTQEKENLN